MASLKRTIGTVLLGALFWVPVPATAETLADALIAAYRNSNLLEQNRAVLRAADEDVAQAATTLRPIISLDLDSGYINSSSTRGLSTSISLTASLTLLDFGRSKASREAVKQTVLATRQALIGIEQDVLLDAVSSYVSLRQQQDIVTLREANVRLITQELRAANDRFEVGEVTRTDVSIAEARLAAARSALAAAQGDVAIARETYKLAVGVYPKQLARPPTSPTLPRTLTEARDIAIRTHPSIRQLQFEVAAAEANVARAKANFGPSLSGSASVSDGIGDTNTQTLSLTLSQTLYSGGRESSLYRQTLAQRDIVRSRLQQTTAIIAQGVAVAWTDLSVANANITSGNQQIASALTAFEGVREEATLGARTTLEVLDAEQELLIARNDLVSVEAARYISVYSLLAQMGLMTVDHLKLGIPTYDPEAYYNAVKKGPATSTQGKRLDRVLKAIGK
jgi:outer membrane protein